MPPLGGSEALYQAVFEGLEDGCACGRMDLRDGQPVDWRFLAVNPAFTGLAGLGEAAGRLASELLPGLRETAAELLALLGRVASGGGPGTCETSLADPGRRFAVRAFSPGPGLFIALFKEAAASPARDPGRPDEAGYRSIVDHCPDPISLSRPDDGRLAMVNRAWSELTGIPEAEAVGRSSLALGVWARPGERAAAIAELRRDGAPVLSEGTLRSRDGAEHRVLSTVRMVRMGGEELALFMGRDFTDSYRIQEDLEARTRDLQRSESRFRLLFEQAPLGIAMVDSASGRFLAVNPRLGEIFGYAAEELLDATYQAVTHPDHLEEGLRLVAALRAGTVAEVQEEKRYLHRPGGGHHPAEAGRG